MIGLKKLLLILYFGFTFHVVHVLEKVISGFGSGCMWFFDLFVLNYTYYLFFFVIYFPTLHLKIYLIDWVLKST